jgi:hypothetical protein
MSEVEMLRMNKRMREKQLFEAEREDLKSWATVMFDNMQREAAPYNAVLLSDKAKKQMWRTYVEKDRQGDGSLETLARHYGLSVQRARAILVLEGIEQHRRETGRWVGNAAEIYAALPPTIKVVDRGADAALLDPSIAEVPALTPPALVRGEIDEIEMQRVFQAKSLAVSNAEKKAQRFPEVIPPGIDFTVRQLAPASRRTLRGHKTIVVDTSDYKRGQRVDPKVAGTADDPRFHVPMTVHERDGTVRTATIDERRQYFALSDRKPLSVELEPLEQIRKYVLTPVYYRGKPLMRKRFAEYERAFLNAQAGASAAPAAASAAAAAAAAAAPASAGEQQNATA